MNYILVIVLLSALDDNEAWVVVEPPRIGVRFEMPNVPTFKEQTLKPVWDRDEIIVRTRSSLSDDGKTNLTFVYHDEAATPTTRKQVNAVLDGAVTGAIALVNGEMLDHKEFFLKSNKGRDFVYRCEIDDAKLQTTHRLKIRTRILLVRNRLYAMNYIAEEDVFDINIADRYFDSFELVNIAKDLPPKPRPNRTALLKPATRN